MTEKLLDEKELQEAIDYEIISPSFAERVRELIKVHEQKAAEQSFAPDVCHKSPSKTHSWYGSSQGYVCEHCGTRR